MAAALLGLASVLFSPASLPAPATAEGAKGADARIDSLIVQWPDGSSESFTGVAPDRIVTLTRGQGRQEARDGR